MCSAAESWTTNSIDERVEAIADKPGPTLKLELGEKNRYGDLRPLRPLANLMSFQNPLPDFAFCAITNFAAFHTYQNAFSADWT